MTLDEIEAEYKAAGVKATALYLESRMSWYDWNAMHNARLAVRRSRLLDRMNAERRASGEYATDRAESLV